MRAASAVESRRRWWAMLGLAWGLAAMVACAQPPPVPEPDTAGMEDAVRRRIAIARAAVAEEPSSAATWGELGMVLQAHDLIAPAIDAYREAERIDPADVRWPYLLAVSRAVEGSDPQAAAAGFRRSLELDPGYAPAALRLGDLLARGGRLEEAVAAYRRALELAPELAPATLGLGQVAQRLGRTEEAIEHLEAAAEALPNSGTALQALGRAYRQAGRREDADRVARRARQASGSDFFADPLMQQVVERQASSPLLSARAADLMAAGDHRGALALLLRVARMRPQDAEVEERLAAAYEAVGEPERAVERLRRALEIDARRTGARLRLALLLLDAGSVDEALQHLDRASQERPDDPEIGALGGRAELLLGHPQLAAERFAVAAAAGPLPGWAWNEWGVALARSGRFTEAEERFRRALRLEPDNPQGLFHLGLTLEALGRPDEAVRHYLRAQQVEPSPLVAERLAALGAEG